MVGPDSGGGPNRRALVKLVADKRPELYQRTKREVCKAHFELATTPLFWNLADDEAGTKTALNRWRYQAKKDNSKPAKYAIYPFGKDGQPAPL